MQTGNSIYLFDLHNINTNNNILYLEIYAFSYCPINISISFNILFGQYKSYCLINESNNIEKNKTNAICYMEDFEKGVDLNSFYFPLAVSQDNLILKIYNYRKYLSLVYKEFICQNLKNCILKAVLLDKINYNIYRVIINDKHYSCETLNINDILKNKFPCLIDFKCNLLHNIKNNTKIYISGIPSKIKIKKKNNDKDTIPNQFIISKIYVKSLNTSTKINLYSKLDNDLPSKIFGLNINLLFPKCILKCNLQPYSHYIESNIICFTDKIIKSNILIENQIVYLHKYKKVKELLLINEETYIKKNLMKIYILKLNILFIKKKIIRKNILNVKIIVKKSWNIIIDCNSTNKIK